MHKAAGASRQNVVQSLSEAWEAWAFDARGASAGVALTGFAAARGAVSGAAFETAFGATAAFFTLAATAFGAAAAASLPFTRNTPIVCFRRAA